MDTQPSLTPATPTADLLDDFLSLATHQLRSPLTTISWTIELLLQNLEAQSPEALRHKLEVVNLSTHNMIDLINDILTVAHLNQESMVEDQKPHQIPALLQNILDELKALSAQKQVTVELTVANPELRERLYNLDAKLFHDCFRNLLTNAIRYSNPGGQVQVSVSEVNQQVCITIVDHGVGISETDLPHIFEKFFRGQTSLNQTESGSGLGLFITQTIVKRWQGEITITSQENQGTTATVCLPLPMVS